MPSFALCVDRITAQGEYANRTGADFCDLCEKGFLSGQGKRVCDPCPTGRFARVKGLWAIINTPALSDGSAGSQVCSLCPVGEYAPSTGTEECTVCESGRSQAATGTESNPTRSLSTHVLQAGMTVLDVLLEGQPLSQGLPPV